MTALAGAFALGVALQLLGAPLPSALSLLAAVLLPVPLWRRPGSTPSVRSGRPPGRRADPALRRAVVVVAAVLAGHLHASARAAARARDCRGVLVDGQTLHLRGTVRSGGGGFRIRVAVVTGLPGGCRRTLLVRPPSDTEAPAPGEGVQVEGRWLRWSPTPGGDPERAGEVRAEEIAPWTPPGGARTPLLVRWRVALEARVARLFPERGALVAALVLARRDGLDAGVREAFARAGVAHLLAISGFHVGVVAGLVLLLLRACLLGRSAAAATGAACVWGYVLLIGAPDAAVRAAVILTLSAAGRLLGRPLLSAGALATALLALLLADPGALARPGFQLSFAGAAGLALVAPPLGDTLGRWGWWPPSFAPGPRSAVVAGVAATVVTLPVVAWHFDRVSLVGVPTTLAVTPLITAAIPGILASLVMDGLGMPGARFVAGGVGLLLTLVQRVVEVASGFPLASVWATRQAVLVGSLGGTAVLGLLAGAREMGVVVRGLVVTAGAGAALLLAPLAEGPASAGTVEIRALDVGQGDALLLRSPGGHWVLVDTGPGPAPGRGTEKSDDRFERLLRRQGVHRLWALVLTHPDGDHIGQAAAVLRALPVGAVLGSGFVRETVAYGDALAAARAGGVRWIEARRGDVVGLDGMRLTVLNPVTRPDPGGEPNAASVVLLLEYGAFRALLTGDAPVAVEDGLAPAAGDVDVLKVGHHGSRTSTSAAFLATVRPEIALLSVGRANRYGHPHRAVLRRLEAAGARILRTDRDGTLRIRGDRDGRVEIPGLRWNGRDPPG